MRTYSGHNPQFRGLTMSVCTATYSETVLTFLQRSYAPLRHAAKLLARDAKTSPRTAEKWLSGLNAPSGESLIELMASSQELADEVNRLVAERRASRNENIRR